MAANFEVLAFDFGSRPLVRRHIAFANIWLYCSLFLNITGLTAVKCPRQELRATSDIASYLKDLPVFTLAFFSTPSRKSEWFSIAATYKLRFKKRRRQKETVRPIRTNWPGLKTCSLISWLLIPRLHKLHVLQINSPLCSESNSYTQNSFKPCFTEIRGLNTNIHQVCNIYRQTRVTRVYSITMSV